MFVGRAEHEVDGDEDLLRRWRSGDVPAGQALFERHYPSVSRFFRNKTPTHVQRDLVQRTFLACVEAAERFAARSSFRTFLLGIAHNVLLDHLRTTQRRGDREVDLDDVVLADSLPDPGDLAVARQDRRLLLEGLRRLRFPLQLVLELHYWEALADAEIAAILAWPVGTVKTRLRAGRQELEVEVARLAASPAVLRSTMDTLQRWAQRVHEQGVAARLPDAGR